MIKVNQGHQSTILAITRKATIVIKADGTIGIATIVLKADGMTRIEARDVETPAEDLILKQDTHHGSIGRVCTALCAAAKDTKPKRMDALPPAGFSA